MSQSIKEVSVDIVNKGTYNLVRIVRIWILNNVEEFRETILEFGQQFQDENAAEAFTNTKMFKAIFTQCKK